MSAPDPEATEHYSREGPGLRGAEHPAETGGRGPAGMPSQGPATLASPRSLPGGTLRTALAVAGGIAGLALVVAELLPLLEIVVGSLATVQQTVRGGPNHAYALGVLGTLAIMMAFGAARGSRPAAAALVVVGVGGLAVALGVDLPDTRASGSLPQSIAYEDARARAAAGFYVELVGAVGLVAAGGGLLGLARGGRLARLDGEGPQRITAPSASGL